ncbi:DUF1534 domain-containing protein [Pseudomonas syringae]|nr:DUF1534 domain-containing protein [Pseudomonas syringae]MCF5473491.1 DUF1534 domain-containing protein [Pseudomonas syringae]MCF5483530.1 DUF1534 domain-containing protein [Pseudomonas syringae]MCF5488859.1 DUF1534 domain-containing protein [Pseudomonas syringae]MCF5494899.1 DUF1534 domain-containing protein [Pseudomonas syringae]
MRHRSAPRCPFKIGRGAWEQLFLQTQKQKRPEQVGAFCVLRGCQLSRLRVSRAGFSPRGRAGN